MSVCVLIVCRCAPCLLLLAQKRIRILLAIRFVEEERRRKLYGPPVIEMLRKGMEISGRTLTVVINRCGNQYRVTGQDVISNAIYESFFHRDDVQQMLERHNSCIVGNSLAERTQRIQLWHYDRVSAHIATKLRLVRRCVRAFVYVTVAL